MLRLSMLRCVPALVILALLCVLAGPAVAAPITYLESLNGDLPDAAPLTLFTVDLGLNTISGSTAFSVPIGADIDNFAFTVPVGMEVQSMKVLIPEQTVDYGSVIWDLRSGSILPYSGTPVASFTIDPVGFATYNTPVPAGTYTMNQVSIAPRTASNQRLIQLDDHPRRPHGP